MLKDEWLQSQLIEIGDNKKFKMLYKLIEQVLNENSSTFIDFDNKSISSCFENIKDYASDHSTGNFYCVDEDEARKIICDYFGIKILEKVENKEPEFINLSDFLKD